MVFTNALFFFGYAYISVYLLIPKFLLERRIFVFFIAFVLTGFALSLLKFLFSDYIFYQAIAPENAIPGNLITLQALLVNTKDMTFIVAVFALAKFARDHYTLELNNRELQRKELEAELKLIEHQMRVIQKEIDASKAAAEEVIARLAKVSVTISKPAGDNERLFGSVTTRDIGAALAGEGIKIDRRNISIEEAIKTLGVYTVKVRLHGGVTGDLKVWVVKE